MHRYREPLGSVSAALSLCLLSAPIALQADWSAEVALAGEAGSGSAIVQGWLQQRSRHITQRLQFHRSEQSGGDEYLLSYRSQFNISHSFYHFAEVSGGANREAGIDRWQSAVVATANSPYRGTSGKLELKIGLGLQRVWLQKRSLARDQGFQAVWMFGGHASRQFGERWRARADLTMLAGDGHNDLRTAVAIEFDTSANTHLALAHRSHRLALRDNFNTVDEAIVLSIHYRFDWVPTNRWPASEYTHY